MRFGKLLGVIIFVVALAGGAFWIYQREYSDPAQIRAAVERLAEALSKPENENAAVSLLKIKTITDSFVPPLTVALPEYISGNFSEEEITAHAGRYRSMMKRARVYAHQIEFDALEKSSAKIWFSGHFDGESKSGFTFNDVKEIEMELIKVEKTWKISSVAIRQVLH